MYVNHPLLWTEPFLKIFVPLPPSLPYFLIIIITLSIIMNNSSSNPSDYEFLLRTLAEGNHLAKAQSLKRFNTLVLSDKKQFASYGKRIVIAIQQLMLQQKEDINLLAGTLALQIINLNPKDIEFYIKTKLLRSMVVNLGDPKPQIRKTSHYCLLAYVRMFKNFDDLIEVYITHGLTSPEWQLRQKSINSFQSILVMEMKYLNWASAQFRKVFEHLLNKLKDQNGFVQKAAEQCLLSLSKIEEIRTFSKKLPPSAFQQLKAFCQQQYQLGNLNEIKLEIQQKKQEKVERNENDRYDMPSSPNMKQNQNTVSLINTEKLEKYRVDSPNSRQLQQQLTMHKKGKQRTIDRNSLRKVQSMSGVNPGKQLQYSLNLRSVRNHQRSQQKNLKRQSSLLFPPIANFLPTTKQQKLQQLIGKKVIQDLRNDKDWKIRLQAIQELQTKFLMSKQEMDPELIMKSLLPILIKLLGDANFKVALIALKVLEDILRIRQINLDSVVPQVVDKLTDNKVALRQNIGKLIKSQYSLTKQPLWIDHLLIHLKKTSNANVREQIINILLKFYEQGNINYSFEKMLQAVFPMMDDLKTKIKIKTLDLLAMITIKSTKIDRCKNLLATKLNQVYYEMYLQKIGKQLKAYREANPTNEDRTMRSSLGQMSRKVSKIGNTTSTSLQKFTPASASPQKEQNSTVKTAFYEHQPKMDSITPRQEIDNESPREKEICQLENISVNEQPLQQKKRTQNRYLRRRVQKSTESRLSTTNYSNDDAFPPFHEPGKQLKNMLLQLKSDDWQVSNEALNKFRRIIIHHSDLLTIPTLKAAIPDLMKLAQSLRSTLSKNALVVLNELSAKVKKLLDTQFDLIFSKLIKKSLDTNSFISEQVKRALITICSNCNEGKVLTMLTTSHISRAIPIKTAIANILQGVTFLPRFYERELQRVVMILVDFMNEGSLQIREKTKNLLNNIIMSDKGAAIMKLIPVEMRNKLKKRQQSLLSQSKLPIETSNNITAVAQQKQSIIAKQPEQQEHFPRKKKKNKIIDFPSEFQQLQTHLQACQSSDWKVRLQSMTLISQTCLKYHQQFAQHKSSSKVIDVLSKQINDPNVKVAINALKVFQQLTNAIPSIVESSLSVIMNQVFICFSSAKTQIRALAQDFFEIICGKVQTWMLTQHLCNGALYSVQKSRPIIIDKLRKIVPSIHKTKPNIFQKNVYAMINKVAQQNKPDLTSALKELLQTIYTEIGEECMSFLKQKAKNLIFE